MSGIDITQEKQLQYEKDQAAFNTLSPRQKRAAELIAKYSFKGRAFLSGWSKTLLVALDALIQLVFVLPYVLFGKLIKKTSDAVVKAVKLSIKGVVRFKLRFGKNRDLLEWREKLMAWEKKKLAAIDKAWDDFKEKLVVMRGNAARFLERYGAVGLYRVTSWFLNPRTPSGKPLCGNETLNKAVGIVAGLCLFAFLSFQLAKMSVMANFWHAKIVQVMMKDVSPLYIKIPKEVALHLTVAIVVTGSKFVSLPVIAASRGNLKSTAFAQGIAYQYNARLRTHKAKKEAEKEAKTKKSKLSLAAFFKNFFAHIIETASPEFYEARIKGYRQQDQAKKDALKTAKLAENFNQAEQPPVPPAPPADPAPPAVPPAGPV